MTERGIENEVGRGGGGKGKGREWEKGRGTLKSMHFSLVIITQYEMDSMLQVDYEFGSFISLS